MVRRTVQLLVTLPLAAVTLLGAAGRDRAEPPPSDPIAAALPEEAREALALQVALDRARFSPGEIDGRRGAFTEAALAALRAAHGIQASGTALDTDTRRALGEAFAQPLTRYTITADDAAGPFIPSIPSDLMAQAELETLGYTSLLEMLAERFHASPDLLTTLNPDTTFEAGATILVPAVEPLVPPARSGPRTHEEDGDANEQTDGSRATASEPAPAAYEEPRDPAAPKAAVVELTETSGAVVVRDAAGTVLLYAPATVGSEQDPLPVGDWKVVGVHDRPVFHYNPDLFWDADPTHAKARIAPGPNNPVGLVWIDIDKEHFGFHGTPEPSTIGRTASHGCVRLTNWDALRLADLVAEGTPVRLR